MLAICRPLAAHSVLLEIIVSFSASALYVYPRERGRRHQSRISRVEDTSRGSEYFVEGEVAQGVDRNADSPVVERSFGPVRPGSQMCRLTLDRKAMLDIHRDEYIAKVLDPRRPGRHPCQLQGGLRIATASTWTLRASTRL